LIERVEKRSALSRSEKKNRKRGSAVKRAECVDDITGRIVQRPAIKNVSSIQRPH